MKIKVQFDKRDFTRVFEQMELDTFGFKIGDADLALSTAAFVDALRARLLESYPGAEIEIVAGDSEKIEVEGSEDIEADRDWWIPRVVAVVFGDREWVQRS